MKLNTEQIRPERWDTCPVAHQSQESFMWVKAVKGSVDVSRIQAMYLSKIPSLPRM